MQVNITPKKLHGSLKAPANKSLIIRYLIIGRIRDSECIIRNCNFCDDVLACLDCLENLEAPMPCGDSATVLRLLLPSVIKKYGKADFILGDSLKKRPLGPYADFFDVRLDGNRLHAEGTVKDSYCFDSEISSQFASGLLIAGAKVSGKFVSGPYIRMTEDVLSQPTPFDVTVPEDETLSAYWHIGELTLGNVDEQPDMYMPWALQCRLSGEKVDFGNIDRLKYKESDRVKSVEDVLNSLFETGENKAVIIDPAGDHRIAMMAAAGAQFTDAKTVTVLNAECVGKSYPGFWDDYRKLGGQIDVIG